MGLGKLKIASGSKGVFWPGCRIGCLKIGVLFGSFWMPGWVRLWVLFAYHLYAHLGIWLCLFGDLLGSVCGVLLDAFMGLVGSLVEFGCTAGWRVVVSLVVWPVLRLFWGLEMRSSGTSGGWSKYCK